MVPIQPGAEHSSLDLNKLKRELVLIVEREISARTPDDANLRQSVARWLGEAFQQTGVKIDEEQKDTLLLIYLNLFLCCRE